MSEFLDELARSMTKAMPRRRALRMLGGALLGVALPAARATGARATHDCPAQDAFLCQCPSINGLFYKICCPNETPGAKYKCTCKAPPNGEARCTLIRKKTCGPDITSALEDALSRVKSEFAGWSGLKRYNACGDLVTLPAAAFSWDIRELGPGGREAFTNGYPGCGTCGNSVQVGNDCHYSGSVNYAAYGVMMRLCHDYMKTQDSAFTDWFSSEEMLELIYMHKNKSGTPAANFQASNEWALAGYRSGSLRPFPPGDRKECTGRCSKSYAGPGLTVNWLPWTIRP
jgi:hypothetical protein